MAKKATEEAKQAQEKPEDTKPTEDTKPAGKLVQLRALDQRNNTVDTRWGKVTFDSDGLAELEVPEEEIPMLRAMQPHSWLAEDHTSYQMALRGETGLPEPEPLQPSNVDADGLRTDGPTIEEWVKAGYLPEHYPPNGYASKPSKALDAYLAGDEKGLPWDVKEIDDRRLKSLGHERGEKVDGAFDNSDGDKKSAKK